MRETCKEELIERDRQRDASSARQAENEMDTEGFCIKSMYGSESVCFVCVCVCACLVCVYMCLCVCNYIWGRQGDRQRGTTRERDRLREARSERQKLK